MGVWRGEESSMNHSRNGRDKVAIFVHFVIREAIKYMFQLTLVGFIDGWRKLT